jgi:endoglycosylceramidase
MSGKTVTALLIVAVTVVLVAAPATVTVSANPQSFLSAKGTWIVNAKNQTVLLRGVNYPGYESQDDERGGITLHSESAYRTFAQMGFNVVRLPISWEMLEPYPGIFNDRYLASYVDRDVQWAKKYGLYMVLDMHQYCWAVEFGGSGAPDWSVQQYAPTELGMRKAVSNFWVNGSLQDHLSGVWRNVARHYANEPTVAGYDILNEPRIYTSVISDLNGTHVNSFYLKVVKSIKSVDPNHVIFLEPANMHVFNLTIEKNIVWSPHFYPLAYASEYYPQNITVLEADLAAKYLKFSVETGTPIWIGEFGAFMRDKSYHAWLEDARRLFDKYHVGWAWWAFGESGTGELVPSCLSPPSS